LTDSTEHNGNLTLRPYIAIFIDILGQGNKLQELRKLEWWKLTPETKTLLSETYGCVRSFRNRYLGCHNIILPSSIEINFLNSNPPDEHLKLWNASYVNDLQVIFLADSIIAHAPIQVSNDIFPFASVEKLMRACCLNIILSFWERRSIRGGIAIGPCIFNRETKEVYGSALSIAVDLEKDADWPRLLVDSELVRVARIYADKTGKENAHNATMAQRCLSLIAEDDDGKLILDYLGQGFRQPCEIEKFSFITEKAKEFILSQVSEHSNNPKILQKYEKVRDYFKKHGIL
jgi:hypothetical protein